MDILIVFFFSDAPVYLSYPHFYDADPTLLEPFEGLKPDKKRHETYFYIQDVSYEHFNSNLVTE